MKKILFLLFLVTFLHLNSSYPGAIDEFFAAENVPEEVQFNYFGAGAIMAERPYTGVDDDIIPIPLINAQYQRVYIDYNTLGFIIGENDYLRASVIAKPRLMGYEADDSNDLAGMEDREWSVDGGLGFVAKQDYFTTKANFVTDTLGEHKGHEATVVVSTELFKGILVPRCGAKWQSKDLIDYYYGVEPNEVRVNRPAYAGDDAINYTAGTQIRIPFLEKWVAVLDVEYEHLDDIIKESPIVNQDSTMRYAGGIVYKF
ncbi:MAG: MipA/OmpV family protein [Candidatus Omnitrophica bacterium]|nr:MipA/OmpV family protein [Candidatus Omnitrophota bacterium]